MIGAGLAVLMMASLGTPLAESKSCSFEVGTGANLISGSGTCSTPGQAPAQGQSTEANSPYVSYYFKPLCSADSEDPRLTELSCSIGSGCPQQLMPGYLYGSTGDGTWVELEFQCRPLESATTITPEQVASAFVRIPLPRLRSQAQPASKTLVNLDTIFFVEARPLSRTITLLGQQVELAIRPSSFTWAFGDGSSLTTDDPGAPYPSKDVVHRYERAGDQRHQVTVAWSARWRLPGGAWRPVPGTATTIGPATGLRVVEAVPNLAGEG